MPLMVPSESRVGTPEPLNERYPTKTAGAPGVASVSGRTSAASKAQVKLIGHAFVGIVAKASPQPNTAPIKTTISENLFIPTLFLAPMLKLPAASYSHARRPGSPVDESKIGVSVECHKTQQRTAAAREIERAWSPAGAAGADAGLRREWLQYPSLFCTIKMVCAGVPLASKTMYPIPTAGCPGLVGSLSGFVCAKLNAHLKFATGQVVVGPVANAPLLKIATVQIAATTKEIVFIRKRRPPRKVGH